MFFFCSHHILHTLKVVDPCISALRLQLLAQWARQQLGPEVGWGLLRCSGRMHYPCQSHAGVGSIPQKLASVRSCDGVCDGSIHFAISRGEEASWNHWASEYNFHTEIITEKCWVCAIEIFRFPWWLNRSGLPWIFPLLPSFTSHLKLSTEFQSEVWIHLVKLTC